MARIRTIKPTHWGDKELPNISLPAHLFWIATWNFSDDKGAFEYDPILLRSQIFPRRTDITIKQIEDWCQQLSKARFIVPVNYKGVDYYVSRTFEDHQRIDKPQPSKIPSEVIMQSIEDNSKNGPRSVAPVLYSSSKGKDSKGILAPKGAGIVPMPPEQKEKYEEAKKTKAGLVKFIEAEKPTDIEPYFFLWNLFATKYSLSIVQKITNSRKRKFNVRMHEGGFDFVKVLEKASVSEFLKSGKWFGFDWIIANDKNWLKVIEGNYDKGIQKTNGQDKSKSHSSAPTRGDQLKTDLNFLIERYKEVDFDERIIDLEIYDRMVIQDIIKAGSLSKFKADSVEEQKKLAVLSYVKEKSG